MWATFYHFPKNNCPKQSPSGRKFTQSGHPGRRSNHNKADVFGFARNKVLVTLKPVTFTFFAHSENLFDVKEDCG
jgi:hypothetical protein